MKDLLLIIFISWYAPVVHAQDSIALPKKITLNGYIKDLQTLSFDKNFKEAIAGNLIHNRINIKWKPSAKVTAAAELRNRLYWGEEIRLTPGFASLLRNDNEKIDMQKAWIDNRSLVFHSNVERLYIDYHVPRWNVRIGRQRINWGVTTTWNPNDIFNEYNFLDFDYEERPGVDGVKIQHIFGNSSGIELAAACAGKNDESTAALKYSFNKWNYDMQFTGGWYKEHPTVGAGWAGYVSDAGFKGEVQYFFGNRDQAGHVNISVEGDYMFKKGWYVNIGSLFNESGLYKPVSNWDTINLKLSPENLMPTKWNMIMSLAKEFTPLFSIRTGILYAPGTRLLILLPSIQYNMAPNLDVNLVWQSFFAELGGRFDAVEHLCHLRFKWSF